ncbi:Ethanolamine ammonia-lyase heavy chain [freshwater sediment metagenome]|uniref:Ethanolamine ammonia-lyase heavy chain n=1 Tax=freshwater sediment metagenome TaxID=556182 RepID=A0AA48M1E8_9ZZZZ
MATLKPLMEIHVPSPKAEVVYETVLFDRRFAFKGLKRLLGAADYEKAGDRLAGLSAASDLEREAARAILSGLKLREIYESPLVGEDGRVDEVMRANYDIDEAAYNEFAEITIGDAKNFILNSRPDEIAHFGRGLTGVMAASIAKLMDVQELIYASKKIQTSAHARTTVGLPNRLSSRLQPNHPTDDLSAVTLLVYTGLSLGAGDALIGVNPALDTVENTSALLRHIDRLRRETGAPTQICVLSHIRTQLACLENGAPVEILFQSLAGTERTLTEEFDCSVELLDNAYAIMSKTGALQPDARQFMYFETGQGSEVSYNKHEGVDMATAEALCYGLARRYDPFMVNNVTGFIGPETHLTDMEMILSNLQDHFMGKLLGLPMGMAPCYTLHSQITTEGQQIATTLLTAAGANYFMDVYLGVDRMLAYFDTSAHDDQTLREIFAREPAPEFTEWAIGKGVYQRDTQGVLRRGPNWGNPRIFCETEKFEELQRKLPAAYGWDNAGPRPANAVARETRANIALAREAIHAELSEARLGAVELRRINTAATTKAAHLAHPELGARLDVEALDALKPVGDDAQILISDGLSAEAIHHNIPRLLPLLLKELADSGISVGAPLLAPNGRVKLAEAVGDALAAKLVISLIGERPGGDGMASRSMSAYLAYRVGDATGTERRNAARYEYTVISNIYDQGAPPAAAAAMIAEKVRQILSHQAAGNRLEALLQRRQ